MIDYNSKDLVWILTKLVLIIGPTSVPNFILVEKLLAGILRINSLSAHYAVL